MTDVVDFVLAHLPPAPARVLEVGCGEGGLTRALVDEGYDVVAVDPKAPEGPNYQRVRIEDFTTDRPFDAAVTLHSLHHVQDLAVAVARIAQALAPGGRLIVEEQAWDRLDRETAAWLYTQKRVLASRGGPRAPETIKELEEEWEAQHEGLHDHDAITSALEAHFDESLFEWIPILYRQVHGLEDDVREDEAQLIAGGAIRAVGFRYVGVKR